MINIEEKDFTYALQQYSGAYAEVWMYSASLKRLLLRLYLKDKRGFLYLLAVSCHSMSGPFAWVDNEIEIAREPENENGQLITRITDRRAGFELVCKGGVYLIISDSPDFGENFAF
jgi:hypothetical protein